MPRNYFDDYNNEELGRPAMNTERALFYTLFDALIFGIKWGLAFIIVLMFSSFAGTEITKSLAVNVCPLLK